MPTLAAEPTRTDPPTQRPRRTRTAAIAVCVLLLLAAGWYFADQHWPYRYRNVKPVLENVFASQITVKEYHRTFFPHPGFAAAALILHRNQAPNIPPIGETRELLVQGRWIDLLLLRNRIQTVDVTGLHLTIPPVGSTASHEDFPPGSSSDFAGPITLIAEFHLHDALLEIGRTNNTSFLFPIHELVIRNFVRGQTIRYEIDMQNAIPTGHILSSGTFGPLNPKNLGATPLFGDFTFSQVNLREIGNLDGVLDSSGHFQGTIDSMEARASTRTAGFSVGKGQGVGLDGTVQATVNALNGDVVLHSIDARTGNTAIHAHGTIVGGPKVTNLDLNVENGRVQDLMRPFVRNQVPLTGAVWLHSHATLLPAQNGASFLNRLQMDGAFNVPAERLTKASTQQSLSAFSQRAQGAGQAAGQDDADLTADVLSSLGGPVTIRRGIASTPSLSFQIPGAVTRLAGTYDLHTSATHLTGDLRMDSDLSHITTGFKSLLLKPLAPFFKRGTAGAVVPIAITGTSGNYKIGQNILGRK